MLFDHVEITQWYFSLSRWWLLGYKMSQFNVMTCSLFPEQVCFGESCAHDCHCTGDVICNSSDGDCGEAECDTGSDYQYYGPPACQRVKKSLSTAELLEKKEFIQAYLVSSWLILDTHLCHCFGISDKASVRPRAAYLHLYVTSAFYRMLTMSTLNGRISALEFVTLHVWQPHSF